MRRALCTAALALALTAPLAAQQQVISRSSPVPQEAGSEAPQVDRFARARANWEAIRNGRRAAGDLSAEELQDVLELDRRLQGNYPDSRTPKQKCIDQELARARGQVSALAMEVIRLKCR